MKCIQRQLSYRLKRMWLGFLIILLSMSILLLFLGCRQSQALQFVILQGVATPLYDTSIWAFLMLPFLFLCFFTIFFLYKAQRNIRKENSAGPYYQIPEVFDYWEMVCFSFFVCACCIPLPICFSIAPIKILEISIFIRAFPYLINISAGNSFSFLECFIRWPMMRLAGFIP